MATITTKITPFLWMNNQAEEAANFYVGIFNNSRIRKVIRNVEGGAGPKGSVLVVDFELDGQVFSILNGGPEPKLNHAVSFMVHCQTQQEIDYYWQRLGEGGQYVQCGWLTDRFGLSWQVVPTVLLELIADPDQNVARRVTQAMMQSMKFDIDTLQRAARG